MSSDRTISEKDLEKLTTIAKRLSRIRMKYLIVTANTTPINFMEEKEKFFKSDSYNPFYRYNPVELPNIEDEKKEIYSELKNIHIPADLQEHIEEVLGDLDLMEKTKRSIGTEKFSEYAHQLLDWGSDRLDMILTNTPKVSFALYTKHKLKDAAYIKERFAKVLLRYGINELPITIDDFSTHIISITSRGIKIGSQVKRYQCNVDRLIVHEIESHALQIMNVRRNSDKLSDLTRYSNMNLYTEGLAVYNEIATRKITPEAFSMYFNRIRAVHMLDKSFRDIFNTLSKYIPSKNAFIMTYRVKRGMSDTSQPGGFPKDAAYLLGYHEIENLVAEGFSRKLLYATKSPVLSSLLEKYGLLDTKNLLTPRFSK